MLTYPPATPSTKGPGRRKIAELIATFDIVISTYSILGTEYGTAVRDAAAHADKLLNGAWECVNVPILQPQSKKLGRPVYADAPCGTKNVKRTAAMYEMQRQEAIKKWKNEDLEGDRRLVGFSAALIEAEFNMTGPGVPPEACSKCKCMRPGFAEVNAALLTGQFRPTLESVEWHRVVLDESHVSR